VLDLAAYLLMMPYLLEAELFSSNVIKSKYQLRIILEQNIRMAASNLILRVKKLWSAQQTYISG
jgi:hypothetical protein